MNPLSFLFNTASIVRAVSGRRVVKNAMTPMLWACAVITVPCVSAAIFATDAPLRYLLLLLATMPVVTTCAMYIYFAIKDPDRLQTEDYNLRDRALGITESKGGKVQLDPVQLLDIANPYPDVRSIEHKNQEKEKSEEQEGNAND